MHSVVACPLVISVQFGYGILHYLVECKRGRPLYRDDCLVSALADPRVAPTLNLADTLVRRRFVDDLNFLVSTEALLFCGPCATRTYRQS